jgi:tetratricopeptide (TPR) repeat protein
LSSKPDILKKRKMKKSAIVLFFVAFASLSALAQSVQEGINHLYAERYQSAKTVFDKLVSSNPNNIEANYWLGQTLLKSKDSAGAAALYQKVLAANGNAPLALVGMGQIELMQGKTAEARQHFETAITLSKGKKGNDPAVLTAIGRANTDVKSGDIAYGIQKLTEASTLAPTNAEVFLALGNAYRKVQGSGSQAATNFIKAASLNPSFAIASYRLGKLYSTQQNWDVVVENYNKALAADPKFAPAYLDLYDYYLRYQQDFTKAQEYADKYIANADKSIENDYLKAQTFFAQKNYTEAINVGKNILAQAGEKANPRVYRLLGHSYVSSGDTATAKEAIDQFFAKQDPDDVVTPDWILRANIYAKYDPSLASTYYINAAKTDSVYSKQAKILQEGIDLFKSTKYKVLEGDLRLAKYKLNPNPNPAELFQVGLPYYQGSAFQRADSVFNAYATALPDSIYGHYWSALARAQQDTTLEKGLAVPAYEKTLQVAEKDKVRFRSQGVNSSLYLAGYTNNIKKDKEAAIAYLKRGLEFDPANAALNNTLKVLTSAPAARPTTPAKTKTSTSSNSAKGETEVKVKTASNGTVKKVKTN